MKLWRKFQLFQEWNSFREIIFYSEKEFKTFSSLLPFFVETKSLKGFKRKKMLMHAMQVEKPNSSPLIDARYFWRRNMLDAIDALPLV